MRKDFWAAGQRHQSLHNTSQSTDINKCDELCWDQRYQPLPRRRPSFSKSGKRNNIEIIDVTEFICYFQTGTVKLSGVVSTVVDDVECRAIVDIPLIYVLPFGYVLLWNEYPRVRM